MWRAAEVGAARTGEGVERFHGGLPSGEAVRGPLGEEPFEHVAERERERGDELARRGVHGGNLRGHDGVFVAGSGEQGASGHGVEEGRAERIHVALRGGGGASDGLFGGHVRGRSPHPFRGAAGGGGGAARLEAGGGTREAEIHHLHPSVAADHDVFGLEVAVDEPFPGPRVAEGVGDAPRDRHRLGFGERAGAGDAGGERFARELFHDDAELAVAVEGVEHAHDSRVGEPGGGARFGLEAVDFRVAADERRVEGLDRDLAPQGDLAGAPDGRGAAGAQRRKAVVPLDARGRAGGRRGQGHRRPLPVRPAGPCAG